MGSAAPGARNVGLAQFPASTDGPMPSRHAAIDGKGESARARTSMPGTPPTLPPRASYRPPDSGASRDRTGIGVQPASPRDSLAIRLDSARHGPYFPISGTRDGRVLTKPSDRRSRSNP